MFLGLLIATPVALTNLSSNGIDLPGAASAARLMAMIDARSPGERKEGVLTATKVRKQASLVPRERALGKVFPPKPPAAEQLGKVVAPPSPPDILAPPATFAQTVTPVLPAPVTSPGGGVFVPPVISGFSTGGGAPPAPPETPPTTTTPVTPVAPAVPEPGTWLMMLLGFGIIGRMVRTNRNSLAAVAKIA